MWSHLALTFILTPFQAISAVLTHNALLLLSSSLVKGYLGSHIFHKEPHTWNSLTFVWCLELQSTFHLYAPIWPLKPPGGWKERSHYPPLHKRKSHWNAWGYPPGTWPSLSLNTGLSWLQPVLPTPAKGPHFYFFGHSRPRINSFFCCWNFWFFFF